LAFNGQAVVSTPKGDIGSWKRLDLQVRITEGIEISQLGPNLFKPHRRSL
jgi:hypothetical protein